ncbi:MAG: PIN domain-containing protein [Gaiellaceae bacterium]
MIEAADAPETLLLDTSFLGHELKAKKRPERYEHWDRLALDRVSRSIRAISVVTVAEERAGWISANWGEATVSQRMATLRGHLWIPIDPQIVDRWSELRAHCLMNGINGPGDNDLWIVATAIEHNLPLVTSDKAQGELPGLSEAIHLAAPH